MKKIKSISLLMLAMFIAACTQQQAAESPAIDKEAVASELAEAWDGYLVAWKNGDAEACLSYMTQDDYLNMPSYDATQDFQETREMFQSFLENIKIENASFEQGEVFVHEDMAYEFGKLHQVWIDASTGDTTSVHNRCMTVWKKTEDDSWKMHRWLAQ